LYYLTIDGRENAKVDGGYDGGKYIKKVKILQSLANTGGGGRI